MFLLVKRCEQTVLHQTSLWWTVILVYFKRIWSFPSDLCYPACLAGERDTISVCLCCYLMLNWVSNAIPVSIIMHQHVQRLFRRFIHLCPPQSITVPTSQLPPSKHLLSFLIPPALFFFSFPPTWLTYLCFLSSSFRLPLVLIYLQMTCHFNFTLLLLFTLSIITVFIPTCHSFFIPIFSTLILMNVLLNLHRVLY